MLFLADGGFSTFTTGSLEGLEKCWLNGSTKCSTGTISGKAEFCLEFAYALVTLFSSGLADQNLLSFPIFFEFEFFGTDFTDYFLTYYLILGDVDALEMV